MNTASTVSYGYLANSPLLITVTFQQSSNTQLTTTKSYDNLNRLTQIPSAPSARSSGEFQLPAELGQPAGSHHQC